MNLEKTHSKKKVLEYFLNRDVTKTEEILNIFERLKGAIRGNSSKGYPYIFVPGKNENKVLLVAHCDTVWDGENRNQKLKYKRGKFFSGDKKTGIGADDRACIAMLYLLRNSGNSLLVTTGEEKGMRCSRFLSKEEYDIINNHNFIVQLDKRGSGEFKCYNVGSEEFIKYIKEKTNFKYVKPFSYTDVAALCKNVCGVNLSVGYYNEHTPKENLVYKDWLKTFKATQKLIKNSKKFELDRSNIIDSFEDDYYDEDVFDYNDLDILELLERYRNNQNENGEISEDDIPELFL